MNRIELEQTRLHRGTTATAATLDTGRLTCGSWRFAAGDGILRTVAQAHHAALALFRR